MSSINYTSIKLPSVTSNSRVGFEDKKPITKDDILGQCLYEIFLKLSTMASRNPDSLLEDLQSIYEDSSKQKLIDHVFMWHNYISKELE